MKREMRRRFVPAYYSRDLYLKLKRIVQGTHNVDEYFQELEMCLLCTGITEDEESTMARFLVGLNKPIADKVDMINYTRLTELIHFAKRAERQIATSYNYNASWCHSQQQGDVMPQFQQQGAATPKSSSHSANRSIPTSLKQLDAKDKAVSSISPLLLLQPPNARQARLSVLSVVVMDISKLNAPIVVLLLHLLVVLMTHKVKRRTCLSINL
jgi:hypothetical protein